VPARNHSLVATRAKSRNGPLPWYSPARDPRGQRRHSRSLRDKGNPGRNLVRGTAAAAGQAIKARGPPAGRGGWMMLCVCTLQRTRSRAHTAGSGWGTSRSLAPGAVTHHGPILDAAAGWADTWNFPSSARLKPSRVGRRDKYGYLTCCGPGSGSDPIEPVPRPTVHATASPVINTAGPACTVRIGQVPSDSPYFPRSWLDRVGSSPSPGN
jgi:hypothetical protein